MHNSEEFPYLYTRSIVW